MRSSPTSIASPPAVVTTNAWPAGREPLPRTADEQEGEDGGEFPEDVQEEQVVGQDQAEHRSGERDQAAGEPAQAVVPGREVARAVEADEGTDAGDQRGEEEGERVEAQGDVELEGRDPRDGLRDGSAVQDDPELHKQPGERRGRHQGEREEGLPPPPPHQHRSGEGPDQMQQQQRGHRSPGVRAGSGTTTDVRGSTGGGGNSRLPAAGEARLRADRGIRAMLPVSPRRAPSRPTTRPRPAPSPRAPP